MPYSFNATVTFIVRASSLVGRAASPRITACHAHDRRSAGRAPYSTEPPAATTSGATALASISRYACAPSGVRWVASSYR